MDHLATIKRRLGPDHEHEFEELKEWYEKAKSQANQAPEVKNDVDYEEGDQFLDQAKELIEQKANMLKEKLQNDVIRRAEQDASYFVDQSVVVQQAQAKEKETHKVIMNDRISAEGL